MGYYNCLGHYVPDVDETYSWTNALGHKVTSTPESRGYRKNCFGKYEKIDPELDDLYDRW